CFLPDATPKYRPDRIYPLDAHCYATAIDTWTTLAQRRPEGLEHAERIGRLLIERMLDAAGYVYFQERRLFTNRTPYVRWTTAPSFRALAGLLLARVRRPAAGHADARLD